MKSSYHRHIYHFLCSLFFIVFFSLSGFGQSRGTFITFPDSTYYSISLNKGGSGDGKIKVNGALHDLPYTENILSPIQRISVPLIIQENIGKIDTLYFGLDTRASYCRDVILGEKEIPPLPPEGVFDTRFVDSRFGAGACLGQGMVINYHHWDTVASLDTFKIIFQPNLGDSGGYPFHFTWASGLGSYFSMLTLNYTDPVDGVVSIDMLTTTTLDITSLDVYNVMIFAQQIPHSGEPAEIVQLEAVPTTPDIFAGWSDALTGTTNPTSTSLFGNQSITANFDHVPTTYQLSLTKEGSGNGNVKVNGTVHNLPYTEEFPIDVQRYSVPFMIQWGAMLNDTIRFGADTRATNCIDSVLGEYEISPVPPEGNADMRFINIPGDITGCLGFGSKVNYRRWDTNPATDTFIVQLQSPLGSGGYSNASCSWFTGLSSRYSSLTLSYLDSNSMPVTIDMLSEISNNINVLNRKQITIIGVQIPYTTGLHDIVQVEALPFPGNEFTSWSGAINDSINPTAITMNADKNVNAVYTYVGIFYPLYLSATGTGSGKIKVNGTVRTLPYSENIPSGNSVQLQAVPDTGSSFSGWGNAITGMSNPVSLIMDAVKYVTVNFTLNPLQYSLLLVKGGNGNGTVKVNGATRVLPYLTNFPEETSVQLEAIPTTGCVFTGWGDSLTGNVSPISIIMNTNKRVIANFAVIHPVDTANYLLSITKTGTGNGNIKVDGITHTLPYTALIPVNGKRFSSSFTIFEDSAHNGSVLFGLDTRATHCIDAVVGEFELPPTPPSGIFDIRFVENRSNNGSCIGQGLLANYHYWDTIPVVDTFKVQYQINNFPLRCSWDRGLSAYFSSLILKDPGNGNAIVNMLTDSSYEISSSSSKWFYLIGITKPPIATATNTVSLEAEPNPGSLFSTWEGDTTTTSNPITINVYGNKNISANFSSISYTVNVSTVGGGSVTKNPDLAQYTYGNYVQLTAIPDSGWVFNSWSGDVAGTTNPLTLNVNGNKSVTATFVDITAFLVKYRSFLPESLALSRDQSGKIGKPVTPKADKVEFEFIAIVDSNNVNNYHVEFMNPINMNLPLTSVPSSSISMVAKSASKKWDFIFSSPLNGGDTVRVHGFGTKGALQKVTASWWRRDFNIIGSRKLKPTFIKNVLRLPLPNRVNILKETFEQGGFSTTNGMITGIARPESSKTYGWVYLKKYTDVLNSLSKTSKGIVNFHDSAARGFDRLSNGKIFVGKKTSLPPTVQDNRLFAQLAALKLSIEASALGKTPVGFGELIFLDTGANSLNNLMLKEIAAKADTMMTGYPARRFENEATYSNLSVCIGKVLNAFEGAIDTVSFSGALVLKGTHTLLEYTFVKPNTATLPLRLIPAFESLIPQGMTLHQNYPNPFNPVTTISFSLHHASFVTLTVYNILGQEVTSLLSHDSFNEGDYEINFSALQNGALLPSGIYFYRLNAEYFDGNETLQTYSEVKKMSLLK